MTRIAVVGGGAAGIAAARTLLKEGMEVLLLEAAPRLGGNCRAEAVPAGAGWFHPVDLGVSDFNRNTFHEFARLVDELGLKARPIATDASFASLDGRTLCSFRDGRWSFAPELRDTESFLEDVQRFRSRADEVLADERFAEWSVGEYLDHLGASPSFREVYVHARAKGSFPMPDGHPSEYRIRDLIAFWKIHGVVGREPADRRAIEGGMHRYVEAYRDWFVANGGELCCGARVTRIERSHGGVEIRALVDGERRQRFRASHVVLANHAHQALALLDGAGQDERRILASFPFQRAPVVMHRDPRLAGDDRAAFGAFNYVVPSGALPRVRPTITFHPNRLAGLPASVPDVFVTVNPHLDPAPETVIARHRLVHPIAGAATDAAIASMDGIQGRLRTWYAGSYLQSPFVHESAIASGMRAAERILRVERSARARPRRALAS